MRLHPCAYFKWNSIICLQYHVLHVIAYYVLFF